MIATHAKEIVDQYNRRILKLEEGRLVSDLEGKYDSIHIDEPKIEETQIETVEVSKVAEKDEEECLVTIDSEITILELPQDIEKILHDNQVETLENLLDLTEEDLKNIKGLGKKKTEIILAKLESFLNGGQNQE
jgi:DNA-directed RNA polymerase alpha subunit